MRLFLLVLPVAVVVSGCGGGSEEVAPAAWCHGTSRIVYLLDQHSTTLTSEEIGDWEESSPEEIEAHVADAVAVLRRYPVDADAPALVEARVEIEEFAATGAARTGSSSIAGRPPPDLAVAEVVGRRE